MRAVDHPWARSVVGLKQTGCRGESPKGVSVITGRDHWDTRPLLVSALKIQSCSSPRKACEGRGQETCVGSPSETNTQSHACENIIQVNLQHMAEPALAEGCE